LPPAPRAQSIRSHENGKKHLEAVRDFLVESRRKKAVDAKAATEPCGVHVCDR